MERNHAIRAAAAILALLPTVAHAEATPPGKQHPHGSIRFTVCRGQIKHRETTRSFPTSRTNKLFTRPFIDGKEAQEYGDGTTTGLNAARGGTLIHLSVKRRGVTPLYVDAVALGGCHKIVVNWLYELPTRRR